MSKIDDLIAQFAPGGVQFKALGDVLRIRNGKDHKALGDGDIPVYGSGGIMRYADTGAAEGPSVLIPRKGSLGNIFYVEGPFWVVDTIFRTEIDRNLLEPKFLYYQLLTMGLGDMNQAGGVPSQTQTVLNSLRIPVPPLEVQREIVKILDQFTQLEAELEAELEARHRQYEHYRASVLVASGAPTASVTIGDLCRVSRGQVMSKDYLRGHNGPYPVYSSQTQNNGIFGRIDSYACDEESLTWTTDGANAGSIFYHVNEKFSITNVCGLLRVIDPTQISTRYLYYQLRELAPKAVSAGMGNPKLMAGPMSRIAVPVPSIETQLKIVATLDSFDALVNSLSVGLPAELRARRKQYEYYRDKLLAFKETD
ncbi:restriction endonuclease subunit S [Flexivirga alba]|uniref:Restriction endonuclease subunit S n=1 Tax=Flexivirga alba TaxID=702742 RepID=A0ABW2AJ61_9MICO